MSARKSVLITGCSPGGIGHSLAREFHQKGLRVFATARKTETIADLAAEGIETLSLVVDQAPSVIALHTEVAKRVGDKGLDFLVNNAGRNYTVPALDVDFDEVRATFETNLFAVMRMCQVFAPELIQAKGCIVQIGSVAGLIPYVFGSTYNASKAALHAYSDTLRVELAPMGVSVITVVTGGVQSRIARTSHTLPPNSYFIPVATEYDRRQKHSQEGATPHPVYARQVVEHVLKPRGSLISNLLTGPRRYIWAGSKVWLVWTLTMFAPRWLGDRIMTRMFNLWKLARAQKAKRT